MPRRLSGGLLALAAITLLTPVAAGPLAAQDDGDMRVFSFSGRPRIGVTLDYKADADHDKIGARVQSVMPDGPADKSGIKAGDIITKFNGVALGGVAADNDEDSGPAEKLVELARKLRPGDTVSVEYRRGADTRTTQIVARDLEGRSGRRAFSMVLPRIPGLEGDGDMGPMVRGGPPGFQMFLDGAPGGLELTELNPDLGEYFGAKEGVLVLKAPRDSTMPLKAGDVILSIDGRVPTSAAHAERILRSYDPGETAKIEILRKQKKLTVSWKTPDRDREWHWRNGPPGAVNRDRIERS